MEPNYPKIHKAMALNVAYSAKKGNIFVSIFVLFSNANI